MLGSACHILERTKFAGRSRRSWTLRQSATSYNVELLVSFKDENVSDVIVLSPYRCETISGFGSFGASVTCAAIVSMFGNFAGMLKVSSNVSLSERGATAWYELGARASAVTTPTPHFEASLAQACLIILQACHPQRGSSGMLTERA
jgi:hypothetical protein